MKYIFCLFVLNVEMRFFDKINWYFLLKGVLVIGLRSSYNYDKYKKKLILEKN